MTLRPRFSASLWASIPALALACGTVEEAPDGPRGSGGADAQGSGGATGGSKGPESGGGNPTGGASLALTGGSAGAGAEGANLAGETGLGGESATAEPLLVCIYRDGAKGGAAVVLSAANGALRGTFATGDNGCVTLPDAEPGDLVTGVRREGEGAFEVRTVSVAQGVERLLLWDFRPAADGAKVGTLDLVVKNDPPLASDYVYAGYGIYAGFPANALPYSISADVRSGDLNDSGTLDVIIQARQGGDLLGVGYALDTPLSEPTTSVTVDTWADDSGTYALRGLLADGDQAELVASHYRDGHLLWTQAESVEAGSVLLSALSEASVADRLVAEFTFRQGPGADSLARGYQMSTDVLPHSGEQHDLSLEEGELLPKIESLSLDRARRTLSYDLPRESECQGARPSAHSAELRLFVEDASLHWDLLVPLDVPLTFPELGEVLPVADWLAQGTLMDSGVKVYAPAAGPEEALFGPLPVTAPAWAARQTGTTASCWTGRTHFEPLPL